MGPLYTFWGVCALLALTAVASAQTAGDASEWTIYITNDDCPDYTWGLTEEQTRQSFADIVRGHLDEMRRTDQEAPENRDRYNMAVTQEALCFVERYPERKQELIQRLREGRVYVSPYLCNSLWALQSVEGALRTFYPARRLEREWGIPMEVAEHIEEPSLPWGVASILAGCGIRWLSNPFYGYDSTFGDLTSPPLFIWEGPDGSQIRVVMDPWACGRSSYTQGGHLLGDTNRIVQEWLPHYRQLGQAYPVRAILASGTHGDISPHSGGQARGFADAIIGYNRRAEPHPKLVNATLPQFCQAVDAAQTRSPFLTTVRGCFGHSWDVWPVCLSKYVADMRAGERAFLSAEALLAVAALTRPEIHEATRTERERAEWCWAMLSDHAWNGTDETNKRHNADLRRKWGEELNRLSQSLVQQAWAGLGLTESGRDVSIFNSLSIPRADLVRLEAPAELCAVAAGRKDLDTQSVEEDGRRVLCFVSPQVPGFGLMPLQLRPGSPTPPTTATLRATSTELESPYYRLKVDPAAGGLASLIHKATGAELAVGGRGRGLCQTICFDGQEHKLTGVTSEVVAQGPVLARLRVSGTSASIGVSNLVTVYADLDRVDFDVRVTRPPTAQEERLCHLFPVRRDGAVLRVETTGAVLRPQPQPEGDLLPGADRRRFAVQGFLDASLPDGPGVTIAPLDAFVLRLDLEPITFEALGNDQNHREVVQDQHGITEFRFRYALQAHVGGYQGAQAFAWSRSVATPLLAAPGRIAQGAAGRYAIALDPARVLATCLKPADGDAAGGCILRLWEVAGQSGPVEVSLRGYRAARRTDLLERDLEEVPIVRGKAKLDVRAHGFAALRLLP